MLDAVPAWPYSRGWGYYPSGLVGVLLLVVIVLTLAEALAKVADAEKPASLQLPVAHEAGFLFA